MTDYDKAKAECWKELCDCQRKYGETTRKAFEYAFEQGYRYGVWVTVEAKPHADHLADAGKMMHQIPDATKMLRAQAAIAAMQGLLSAGHAYPAARAVELADALIAKLERPTDNGN